MDIRFSCCEKFEFYKKLDNNDICRAFANAAAFVLKLFSGNSNFSQDSSSKLHVSYR